MDIDKHGSVAFEIARRLAQYQANRIALFEWIDPQWLPSAWRFHAGALVSDAAPDAGSGANLVRLRARAVAAWLADKDSAVPSFESFRGDEGLLGALALDDALGALCLRALYFRRAELRYWVDRESREKVTNWLGRGAAALRWLIETPQARPVDRLIRDYGMQPLDHLDDYTLSWEGFCLFRASGSCGPRTPGGLLRYAWPPDAVPPPWLTAFDHDAQREGSLRVLDRLGEFYATGSAASTAAIEATAEATEAAGSTGSTGSTT